MECSLVVWFLCLELHSYPVTGNLSQVVATQFGTDGLLRQLMAGEQFLLGLNFVFW